MHKTYHHSHKTPNQIAISLFECVIKCGTLYPHIIYGGALMFFVVAAPSTLTQNYSKNMKYISCGLTFSAFVGGDVLDAFSVRFAEGILNMLQ